MATRLSIKNVTVVACLLLLVGCSRSNDSLRLDLIGKEYYTAQLPKLLEVSYDDYDLYRIPLSHGQVWVLESTSDGKPMKVLDSGGKPIVHDPFYVSCSSASLASRGNRSLLILMIDGYKNEPMIQLLAVNGTKTGGISRLDAIGGEEWRTRPALSVTLDNQTLTINGVDPERQSVGLQTAAYLREMGMDLRFNK